MAGRLQDGSGRTHGTVARKEMKTPKYEVSKRLIVWNVRSWHIAAFASTQHLGRDWTNNGQTSILARDGYDVNDPSRPSPPHSSKSANRVKPNMSRPQIDIPDDPCHLFGRAGFRVFWFAPFEPLPHGGP